MSIRCGDLISRDAAIGAMGRRPYDLTGTPEEMQKVADWERMVARLKALPSMDPVHITRCRCCRFGELTENVKGEPMVRCENSDCPCWGWLLDPEWYCNDGEDK